MDFNLSQEEAMLRESVARFVTDEYELIKRETLVAQDRDHWDRFVELGWIGLGIPEAAGGYGEALEGAMVIAEVLGGGLALEPYLGAAILLPQVLLAAVGADAGAALLAPVIEGKAQIALAANEYAGRGRLAHIETTAQADGDNYLLNGRKTAVIGGPSASSFLVAARTAGAVEDRDGISLFLLPRDTAGLTVRDYRMIDASPVSDLLLDATRVPASAMLGPPGAALAALEAGTDIATVAAAFGAVGAMREALTQTTEYLKTRKQFGGPLRDFQVLRHRAADMLVALEQARSAAFRGLAGLRQNDAQARAYAVSAMRIVVARCGRFVCGQAIQLHGGMGVTEELRIGHYFKYISVANALFGGDSYHVERMGALM